MKLLPLVALATISTSTAYAQNFEPAPYDLTDGFSIIPQIKATTRYDDNIYNEETDTTSSTIFLITPSIKFGTDDGINQYGGSYELTAANYSADSDDNYIDHRFALLAHTEYTARHRTDFKFGFNNTHEDRGSDLTESSPFFFDEPLKYNELTANGYYQFGGLTSLMRIGGGLSYADKSYTNFRENSKYSDVNGLRFYADTDYQFGSVTFLTFDLSTTDKQYDYLRSGANSKDNQDTVALVGVRWEGLAKTTGTMKVGYQYKTFDSDERENFTGLNVDLGLTWEPLQYSSFTIHAIRNAQDSDTVGDYIETLGTSLEWEHEWSDSFYSTVQYVYTNEDYIGATREDDTNIASLDLNYDLTRWMKVTASYELTNKDSNSDDISYDKNVFNLGVVVSL